MLSTFKAFLSDESGATAIEYGLVAALVSLVAFGVPFQMGVWLSAVFDKVTSTLN